MHDSDLPRTVQGCLDVVASYRRSGKDPPGQLLAQLHKLGGKLPDEPKIYNCQEACA